MRILYGCCYSMAELSKLEGEIQNRANADLARWREELQAG